MPLNIPLLDQLNIPSLNFATLLDAAKEKGEELLTELQEIRSSLPNYVSLAQDNAQGLWNENVRPHYDALSDENQTLLHRVAKAAIPAIICLTIQLNPVHAIIAGAALFLANSNDIISDRLKEFTQPVSEGALLYAGGYYAISALISTAVVAVNIAMPVLKVGAPIAALAYLFNQMRQPQEAEAQVN
jgi:hypothetical protein